MAFPHARSTWDGWMGAKGTREAGGEGRREGGGVSIAQVNMPQPLCHNLVQLILLYVLVTARIVPERGGGRGGAGGDEWEWEWEVARARAMSRS